MINVDSALPPLFLTTVDRCRSYKLNDTPTYVLRCLLFSTRKQAIRREINHEEREFLHCWYITTPVNIPLIENERALRAWNFNNRGSIFRGQKNIIANFRQTLRRIHTHIYIRFTNNIKQKRKRTTLLFTVYVKRKRLWTKRSAAAAAVTLYRSANYFSIFFDNAHIRTQQHSNERPPRYIQPLITSIFVPSKSNFQIYRARNFLALASFVQQSCLYAGLRRSTISTIAFFFVFKKIICDYLTDAFGSPWRRWVFSIARVHFFCPRAGKSPRIPPICRRNLALSLLRRRSLARYCVIAIDRCRSR